MTGVQTCALPILEVEGSSPFEVAIFATVAQLVVQRTCNAQVAGSSPVSGSNGVIVQLVERLLCKQKVVSSILTGSTICPNNSDGRVAAF